MKSDRTPEMDAFVLEAKASTIVQAFERSGCSIGTLRSAGGELVGPCPTCGGRDRFSLAPMKNVFNCRGAEGGGPVSLVMHLTGREFLDACEILVGRDRPGRGEVEDASRAARWREAEARLAEQRRQAEADIAEREREANEYRARAWDRCRRMWHEAAPFDCDGVSAKAYLLARGLEVSGLDGAYLRTHPHLGFFAENERKAKIAIHHGPAMIAFFCRMVPDARSPSGFAWRPVGIHQTWIDLSASPKFRPDFRSPIDGEPLPSKKMQATKAGGLIPVLGRISRATRMTVGEGIETALGFARFDGFREDTFYCAAGDLGNLAGKATPDSRIVHPTLRKQFQNGSTRRLTVPGFDPDMTSETIPVPDYIAELVLLGDGDSEPVLTRAALRRGCARHAREGRVVRALFAPAGTDWADHALEEAA